ncbi:MAG: hypothetical protein NC926_08740 [Candidatus Omnitrophica bacterium]|nr:hypothetical protein [Candidatus Omnitrophota bacterium]
MIDIENLLKRKDKFEISDKFLTSYTSFLGGGSLNIWDGKGKNFDHCSPLDGSDANIYIISPEGRKGVYITNYSWNPFEIKAEYIGYRRTYIKERKTIWDDVFVDLIFLSNEVDCNFKIVCEIVPRILFEKKDLFFDENYVEKEKFDYEFNLIDNIFYLFEKDGVHRNFYKIFSFNKNFTLKKENDKFYLEIPIKLKSTLFSIHAEWEKIVFAVSYSKNKDEGIKKVKKAIENPEFFFEERKKFLNEFFIKKVPYFNSNSLKLNKIYYFCNYVSYSNIYDFKEGNFKNPFTCPSKFRLLPQWFWDSAFHSIYEKYINTEISISSLRNIIQNQSSEGHLPFTLAIDEIITKELVQPFILPIAIWDIYLKKGSKEILKEFLPALIRFDRYLEKYRMEKGLVYLKVPGESGWDNSRRYIPEPPFIQRNSPLIKENRYIFSPDFNLYIYLGRYLIKKMAKELNCEDILKEYEKREKVLKKEIEKMWDENIGLYLDMYIDEEKIFVKTPGGMIPMLGFIPDENKKKKILKHLLNPKEFWTNYPIPTLSLDDPYFNSLDEYQSYWNGRVWPNINWLIIESLIRNNFLEIGKELIEKTINLCIATGEPNCYENYNPFTGFPYSTHNIFNYGWGGIFNDILIRRVCGIQIDGRNNIIFFAPFWHSELKNFEIRNITLRDIPFDIECEKKDKSIKFKIKAEERLKCIYCKNAKIGKTIEGKFTFSLEKVFHFLDL